MSSGSQISPPVSSPVPSLRARVARRNRHELGAARWLAGHGGARAAQEALRRRTAVDSPVAVAILLLTRRAGHAWRRQGVRQPARPLRPSVVGTCDPCGGAQGVDECHLGRRGASSSVVHRHRRVEEAHRRRGENERQHGSSEGYLRAPKLRIRSARLRRALRWRRAASKGTYTISRQRICLQFSKM